MNILLILIPISIVLFICAGLAFFWAVDHDQFDDFETPGLQPLLDAEQAPESADERAP